MNNKKNITSYKKGHIVSLEIKKKLSEAHKGQVPWNKGKKAYSFICINCNKKFASSDKRRKYCCVACAKCKLSWNKGKTGLQVAWNKGHKGLQVAWNKGVSMSSESRKKMSLSKIGKYQKLDDALEIVNNRGYVYKYAGKKKYLVSHLVWCKANNCKKVPNGCVIHHIDHNPKNNNIDNLMLLDRATHCKIHKKDIYIGRWIK